MTENSINRTAIDLLSLGRALPSKHRKLKSLINRVSWATSIYHDLSTALEMLRSLPVAQAMAEDGPASGQQGLGSAAAMALLNNAVLYYVRATKSSSDHRGSIDFLRHYDPEQLKLHHHFCRLRDDAIAHFGPGETFDGQTLQLEVVFVPLHDPQNLRVMSGSRRIVKQRQLQENLAKLTHRALMVAERERQERDGALVAELNRLYDAEDPLVDAIADHHVDLAKFFTSSEEAERVLRSGARNASGAVDH